MADSGSSFNPLSLLLGPISGLFNLFAANKQASAERYAADLQAKSIADALGFTKQQAEGDWRNQELTRRGNFDQWAATQGRLGTLGEMFGMRPRYIPPYVPSEDPRYMQ